VKLCRFIVACWLLAASPLAVWGDEVKDLFGLELVPHPEGVLIMRMPTPSNFKFGDIISAAEDVPIDNADQLVDVFNFFDKKPIQVTVKRGGVVLANPVELAPVKSTVKPAGLFPATLTPHPDGLLVTALNPGTPATYGLQADDLITKVTGKGKRVLTPQTVQDLETAAADGAKESSDGTVLLFVERPAGSGNTVLVKVKPIEPLPFGHVKVGGVGITYVNTPEGLRVEDIEAGSRAAATKPFALKKGWLIVALDGQDVDTLDAAQIQRHLETPNIKFTMQVSGRPAKYPMSIP